MKNHALFVNFENKIKLRLLQNIGGALTRHKKIYKHLSKPHILSLFPNCLINAIQ